jgi:hypothetical protein
MQTTKETARALLTVAEVKDAIHRMDVAIAAAEPRDPQAIRTDWVSFMALKQRRHQLHLLLIARRVEACKKVVSLDKWRHGFDAAEAKQRTPETTKASR